MDTKEKKYHYRCLELAKNGLGHVAPNPLVGAVLVAGNRIIGEGYHAAFGGNHAEVNALNSVKDKSLLKSATFYINLEPCAHYGKTPPCVDLIIENKIPRVVIGHPDPFPEVSGKGIAKLISAGIDVSVGHLETECRYLNRRFLTFYEKKRPYIILKWAETADGFIDVIREPGAENSPTWITDELTRTLVHKWRTEEQGILIGTNTAILDNPMLNSRDWHGKNPLRMVLDRNLRLPSDLKLFNKLQPTVVFTEKKAKDDKNLVFYNVNFSDIINEIFKFCVNENIQSLIVEGGTKTISSFLNSENWDEARVFRGNVFFGNGIKSPMIGKIPNEQHKIGSSTLFIYNNA